MKLRLFLKEFSRGAESEICLLKKKTQNVQGVQQYTLLKNNKNIEKNQNKFVFIIS